MEGMEDQRRWLGTKSKCSSRPPPGHHVTLGPKMERDQIQHVLEAGFGLQKSIDLWWTPRSHTDSDWAVQVLRGNLIKSTFQRISVRSRPQSSILYRNVFCPRCCVILFWPNGSCIKLSQLWTSPRVGARPQHPCGRPPKFLYPLAATKNTWVLFSSS